MQTWGPSYATSGSSASTNPFSFLVVSYRTLYLMVIPSALRHAIQTPLHRCFPMDPDEFNWNITLYLIKGEYYYCNFFLISCPLLHVLVSFILTGYGVRLPLPIFFFRQERGRIILRVTPCAAIIKCSDTCRIPVGSISGWGRRFVFRAFSLLYITRLPPHFSYFILADFLVENSLPFTPSAHWLGRLSCYRRFWNRHLLKRHTCKFSFSFASNVCILF